MYTNRSKTYVYNDIQYVIRFIVHFILQFFETQSLSGEIFDTIVLHLYKQYLAQKPTTSSINSLIPEIRLKIS